MALDPQDKQRLERAYRDHMRVHRDFEHPRAGTQEEYESNERRYYESEAKLERLAEEIGVEPKDYEELEQTIRQGLEGPSIGD